MLEIFEDRALPSIIFSGPGNTGIVTITGTEGPDQFVMQLKPGNAAMIEFSDNNGATFTDAVFALITAVNADGLGGRDTLVIHNDNGLIALPQTIQTPNGLTIIFDGGSGYNTVQVTGNPGGTITETFSARAANGSTLDITSGSLFTHLMMDRTSHLFDTMNADSLTINANDLPGQQNNTITIGLGVTPSGGVTTNTVAGLDFRHLDGDGALHNDLAFLASDPTPDQGDDSDFGYGEGNANELSFSSQFIPVTYANKAHVAVNALGGDDTVFSSVANAATGEQSLTLDGGTGFNVLANHSFPTSGVTLSVQNFQRTDTDRDSIYIDRLYEMRLSRPAEDTAVSSWRPLLPTQGLAAVANAIDQSREARMVFVRHLYERYLGRDPRNGEDSGWVNGLVAQTLSEEQVVEGFMASGEFFGVAQAIIPTGSNDQRYVAALYQVGLGRRGTAGEIQAWVGVLNSLGRDAVATIFVTSPEFRANVAMTLYMNIQRRVGSQAEIQQWVGSSVPLRDMREAFLSSVEAYLAP
jgi:hypothetical protein